MQLSHLNKEEVELFGHGAGKALMGAAVSKSPARHRYLIFLLIFSFQKKANQLSYPIVSMCLKFLV